VASSRASTIRAIENGLRRASEVRALITGDPDAVAGRADVLRDRAGQAGEAGEGLRRIDTGSWTGTAATRFQERLAPEKPSWRGAGLGAGRHRRGVLSRMLR
jgi:hypothetical protein